MARRSGYRELAHQAAYGDTMFGGPPIEDLAGFTGWALLSPRSNLGVAHWITGVDEVLGPGQRIRNIFGRGFHTVCGLTVSTPQIAHEAGDWRRCLRCRRAILEQAREQARAARRRQRPITESFRADPASNGTHPTT